jgi:hypothetical protein
MEAMEEKFSSSDAKVQTLRKPDPGWSARCDTAHCAADPAAHCTYCHVMAHQVMAGPQQDLCNHEMRHPAGSAPPQSCCWGAGHAGVRESRNLVPSCCQPRRKLLQPPQHTIVWTCSAIAWSGAWQAMLMCMPQGRSPARREQRSFCNRCAAVERPQI